MFLRSKIQDIMLRKRTRSVSNKQGLMSDTASLLSPTAASFFTSPRPFSGFSQKGTADPEAGASPTSILETRPFSAIRNPSFFDGNPKRAILSSSVTPTIPNVSRPLPQENGDPRAIGLGLLDVLNNEDSVKSTSKPEKRMVVFGSQLKIQIPPPPTAPTQFSSISTTGSTESLHSPIEFGIKTRNSKLALYSPQKSPLQTGYVGFDMLNSSPRVFTGCLPQSEMELSEDYTRVILHGPNPRTTHIYDNCIIESCGNGWNEKGASHDQPAYTADGFLSFCYGCKKKIGPGDDIYMYRGEKAFCSHECRDQEMLSNEGKEEH
ncbi:FCS-Like Zinc finger 8-like isoform X1 [Musa acuminata AAA Group]|uniref:FCS-Like Zinc finger 8-like isoform X1 n=1 Tax=Musa acuminata AAA Group TaxID=214697 RepID=UPI0031DFF53F